MSIIFVTSIGKTCCCLTDFFNENYEIEKNYCLYRQYYPGR